MRPVKAILIDPFACTITEVEHDADNYPGIYDLISHESKRVDTFTCAYPKFSKPATQYSSTMTVYSSPVSASFRSQGINHSPVKA